MPRIPRTADHRSLPRPYHWHDDAACSGADTGTFYSVGSEAVEAKKLCAGCPVRGECLTHALAKPERYGVWGGKDEEERAELLRQARREADRRRRAKEKADAGAAA